MKTFKIIECEDTGLKTLFHGVDGSRSVPTGEWIKAKVGMGIDGSGQKLYKYGWHSFPTLELARKYMGNFKARLNLLHIVECEVRNTWSKPTNPDVVLSEYIKFGDIVR